MGKTLVTALLAGMMALPLGSCIERKKNYNLPARLESIIEKYVTEQEIPFDKKKLSCLSVRVNSDGDSIFHDVSYDDRNFLLVFTDWVVPQDTLKDVYPLSTGSYYPAIE